MVIGADPSAKSDGPKGDDDISDDFEEVKDEK